MRVKLLHYTRGGPWHGRQDEGFDLWMHEALHLMVGDNPHAVGEAKWLPVAPPTLTVTFRPDAQEVH